MVETVFLCPLGISFRRQKELIPGWVQTSRVGIDIPEVGRLSPHPLGTYVLLVLRYSVHHGACEAGVSTQQMS